MRKLTILLACVSMAAAGCGGDKGGAAKEPAAPLALQGEGLTLMIVGVGEPMDPQSFKLDEFRAIDAFGTELRHQRPTTSLGTKAGPFIGIDIIGQNQMSPIKVEGTITYKGVEYKLQAVLEKSATAGITKWHRKAGAIRRIVAEKK